MAATEGAALKAVKKVRFDGLVFSRYVASCWIVAYHFYGQASWHGPAPQTGGAGLPPSSRHLAMRFFGWGTFWTQYFFFLSGFVLTTARLTSRQPDELKPTWRFVADRLTTTYPAYVFALVLMVFDRGDELAMATKYDWLNFGLHLTLLQAWWPKMVWTTGTLGGLTGLFHWNTPAWFMSALFFYWLLFKPLYRGLRLLPSLALVPAFLGLWACSSATAIDMRIRNIAPTEADHNFYRFNPIMSLHIFVAGMVFARLFAEGKVAVPYSACLGYAACVIAALTVSVEDLCGMTHSGQDFETGTFYFFHNGGLLPLHALLVSGLCSDLDPLTRLFKRPLGIFLGSASYAQYILQAVVFRLVGQAYRAACYRDPEHYHAYPYGPWTWQLVLPATLLVSALTTHYGLSVPCANHLKTKLDELQAALDKADDVVAAPADGYGAISKV